MLVVVLAVLVIVGGTAALLLVRARRPTADDTTVSSADRIQDSYAGATEAPITAPLQPADVDDVAIDEKDEVAAARFRLPGERSTASTFGPPVLVPLVTVRHLEVPDAQEARSTAVDDVVDTLVERVRTSDDDIMSVVSEMVEQDLDTEQMEEVLTELVERDRSTRANSEELTLSGPDVPQRPGRLSAFADMPEQQKRRVIIRVLCLLIARSEERDPIDEPDDRPEYTVSLPDDSAGATSEPTARDLWGEPDPGSRDAHLPARRHRRARVRR